MNEQAEKLGRVLRIQGHSLTKPRLEVFRYLYGKEPVTLSSINKALIEKVDRASIYRTLGLFQELGIAKRHNVGWKYKIELSEMFADHHHHFTCLRCGEITVINGQSLEYFVDGLAKQYGFLATEHQIEMQGYCSLCKDMKRQ